MKTVKESVQSAVENFVEAIQFLTFLFILLCWLIIGLTWTGSVRLYYYTKQYLRRLPWKFTLSILKIYDKLLTLFKK